MVEMQMEICEACGIEVGKITHDPVTRKRLCLKCLAANPAQSLQDEDIANGDERRSSIRIPLTVVMHCLIKDENQEEAVRFPARSVDMSMSGVCFAWDACNACPGHAGSVIEESCIFYPYAESNPRKKPLQIEMRVSPSFAMTVDAHAVYLAKDDRVGFEYMGAKFATLDNQSRRILEKILIRFS